MRREVDRAPLDQLTEIERTAAVIKSVFWEVTDVREQALDLATLARARLRRG
jgi:hypothetical protein